jgi:hypothetical protein
MRVFRRPLRWDTLARIPLCSHRSGIEGNGGSMIIQRVTICLTGVCDGSIITSAGEIADA